MDILVQCAWCHKGMGIIKSKSWNILPTNTTHSICPKCYKIWISDIECSESLFGNMDDDHYQHHTTNKNI